MSTAELQDLKREARETWATGDYESVALRDIWGVGERIVNRLGIGPDDEVLDVACGTGNAAIRAAQAGAHVVGVDLTPELLADARGLAGEAGVEVEWVEGDAEALPFEDEAFDAVISTFGCMFAPRHQVAAGELARVLRPEGRLGVCSWTPEGAVGEFFRTVGGYLPTAPPFASPPLMWGSDDHVREIFSGTGLELEFEREEVVLRFDSVEEAVDYYATKFGPVMKAREQLESEGRWPELEADLMEMFERANTSQRGDLVERAAYLVVVGRKWG
jgi:ubiquinone/menaquinone biosynthesis C-methylase UbiE